VKKVFLVHGEEKQATTLISHLNGEEMHEVYYPELHSRAEI
jgi:hypothetical protein